MSSSSYSVDLFDSSVVRSFFQTCSMIDSRLVAGAVGSLTSSLAVTPFEVIKVKMQSHVGHNTRVMSTKSPSAVILEIYRKDGMRGYYAGLSPMLAMSIPSYVLYLTANDEITSCLRQSSFVNDHIDSTWTCLVGGALARGIATTATAPFEFLKTRQASSMTASSNMMTEFSKIVEREGVRSLFKGLHSQLWRDVPFAAVYWSSMEVIRRRQFREQDGLCLEDGMSWQQLSIEFQNAALAGIIATTCTAPFDVVKTRQQMSMTSRMGHLASSPPSTSSLSTFQQIYTILQKEGVMALWRGNMIRIMKVAPQYAIMVSCFEFGKRNFEMEF